MGLLLAYINFLVYLRTSPIFDVGIYVVMLQVISAKFLRFLPVLLVIICGTEVHQHTHQQPVPVSESS